MTAILGLLRGFWKYIAIFAAGAAALFLYGRGERKKGATAERAKQTEKILEKVETANRVRRSDDRSGVRKFDRK